MASSAGYFERRVPEAWNRRLAQQSARGSDGAELLAKMRAAPAADPKPLVTLGLSQADCLRLESSVGASPMSLLGGVAGNPDFVLTPARLDALREIQGTMRIEVTGPSPWGVVLHFGPPPIPEVTTTVAIAAEPFAQLLAGELDLQGAFMSGKLNLGGNVEVPMKMAMAIMTPE